MNDIRYETSLQAVDWEALRNDLIADDFHNGRTTGQLRLSFENSSHCVMAFCNQRCIGNARALSDGVGNAYVIDMWTQSKFRGRGIGQTMLKKLLDKLQGQHVYLQADDAAGFYKTLGFEPQPEGLFKIVGDYLKSDP